MTSADQPPGLRAVHRRAVIGAGGAIAAGATLGRAQAAPRRRWDHTADVVVVGSGAAALSAAVAATLEGAKVLIVEAADSVGGTTIRSGGGCWVPNNRHMREAGLIDNRADALRYMARYGFPAQYDPASPRLGLTANSHALLTTFFDSASPAFERLEQAGALHTRGDVAYDYWMNAPENKAPVGRAIFPHTPGAKQGVGATHPATAATPEWRELNQQLGGGRTGAGGPLMIAQLKSWLDARKTPVLMGHRVRRLVTNGGGEVIGVEATRAGSSRPVMIRAARATHFGSGGFIHNRQLREAFLRGPAYGGCAAPGSQGDFIAMATGEGAELGNMQHAWSIGLIMEEAFAKTDGVNSIWHLGGDSMFMVDRHGRRVVNEKLNYQDRWDVFAELDSGTRSWRNQFLFLIFDQRTRDLCAGLYPYAPKGEAAPYILRGDTFDGLSAEIAGRLGAYAGQTGGFTLDAAFAKNLGETAGRFNRFAETGVDEEFGRGKTAYDLQWHKRALGAQAVATNDKPNKTLYPLKGGPYYAVALARGAADTSGGPVINPRAQVVRPGGEPIAGLYGAGNCVASPSGRAYWGAGTTLGLAITFGVIAGRNAAKEPVKAET